jgi:histidinol-phosphate aminotransferase
MPTPLLLNPALDHLPVYQPGRPIEEVARELGLNAATIIKLASNENPQGPSPKALQAMRQAITQVHLYPDGNAFYLKQRLAQKVQLPPEQLTLGNGSNELLEFIGHALLGPDTEVVVSQYCFAVYPIVTHLFGARLITVPAREFGHHLPAMSTAITPKTRIVFVANPNNPTGTNSSPDDLRALIRTVPANVLLVIDEAYYEYLKDPVDLLALVRERTHPNLVLVRTFSKIYGLAGLRLGYAMGHPEFIAALEKIREPFNTNLVAQAAALAALDDEDHLRRTRENNWSGLATLAAGFSRLGLKFVPSAANFILVRVGDGAKVFQQMQRLGVITRPMAGYQLPEWLRITVGTPAENQRCLEALAQSLAHTT